MLIRHKYNAIAKVYDGIRFASKREAKVYMDLKLAQTAGQIIFFLRQIPFHLDGGVKYIVDFQIFWADGSVTFVDAKGMRTPLYIAKKKMVEAKYPIQIEER